jgi:hypothetical protein
VAATASGVCVRQWRRACKRESGRRGQARGVSKYFIIFGGLGFFVTNFKKPPKITLYSAVLTHHQKYPVIFYNSYSLTKISSYFRRF